MMCSCPLKNEINHDQSSVPIPSYPGPSDPRPFSATSSAPSPGAGIAPGSSAAPPSDPAAGAGTAPPPAVNQ